MIRTLSCAILLALPISAQTNLLTNGSFESGPPIPTGQTTVVTTGWAIPGWFISHNDVDYNDLSWKPSNGLRSIGLHGTRAGRIQQTFTTLPGAFYEVLFDLGVDGPATMGVTAGTEDATSQIFYHTGSFQGGVTYQRDTRWSFLAADTLTTLRFDSQHTATDPDGPHLDNVRVFMTSPPASFTAFGTGCYGTNGLPTLSNTTRPVIGSIFTMQLTSLAPGTANVPFGIVGISRSHWMGQPLPAPISPNRAPLCNLLISADVVQQLENGGGRSTWPVQIPVTIPPGSRVYMQAAILDPYANPLGVVMSNAGEAVLSLY